MTIISFAMMAVLFAILSFFLAGVWPYYIPVALIFLSVFLKAIQPNWDSRIDSFLMPTTKMDPSAAAGYISIISAIYGIACIVFGYWIPLFLCIGVFILSLTMKFYHPY